MVPALNGRSHARRGHYDGSRHQIRHCVLVLGVVLFLAWYEWDGQHADAPKPSGYLVEPVLCSRVIFEFVDVAVYE